MLGEVTHLQAIVDDLTVLTEDPHKLPPASEQVAAVKICLLCFHSTNFTLLKRKKKLASLSQTHTIQNSFVVCTVGGKPVTMCDFCFVFKLFFLEIDLTSSSPKSLRTSNVSMFEFAYQEHAGRLVILSSSLQAAVFHNSTFKGLHLSLQYAMRSPSRQLQQHSCVT